MPSSDEEELLLLLELSCKKKKKTVLDARNQWEEGTLSMLQLFCDKLITRPEESYRLWCVVVCDLETSRMRRPWPALGRSSATKKKYLYEAQHVSGDTTPIIRSLKLHWQPLVLRRCKVVGRVVAGNSQRPATTRPTILYVSKTRGCQCSFRLLMTGVV